MLVWHHRGMEWFLAAVAVAALGVAAMAAAGGMGEMSSDPEYDTYRAELPEHPLTADDLEQVRFGTALRGYAMSQVDDLLERLGRELAARDAQAAAQAARIAELSAERAPVGAAGRAGRDEPGSDGQA